MAINLSADRLRAWRSVLNAHAAAVRRVNQSLQDQGGLPLESYDVLLELFNAPNQRLRLKDLREKVVLTRSGISRLVSRLEKAGLVSRGDVQTDGRGVHACLTEKGEEAFRSTWPMYARAIEEHFGRNLLDQEARGLADLLERIV